MLKILHFIFLVLYIHIMEGKKMLTLSLYLYLKLHVQAFGQ